jgi:hypothetical protein
MTPDIRELMNTFAGYSFQGSREAFEPEKVPSFNRLDLLHENRIQSKEPIAGGQRVTVGVPDTVRRVAVDENPPASVFCQQGGQVFAVDRKLSFQAMRSHIQSSRQLRDCGGTFSSCRFILSIPARSCGYSLELPSQSKRTIVGPYG